jgi:CubicO group peptidase (beta-lactamase class C family)
MIGKTEANQITYALRSSIERKELAGGSLLVIKEGKEILCREDGYADMDKTLPIRRDSIFRLYSMSKPVTAAAVMILLERGMIDLYEPVSKYLPGFKNQRVEEKGKVVPAKREMIIKDLLSMTSGLSYGGTDLAGQETEALFRELGSRLLGENPMSTIEAMNLLGQCTLSFHPGDSWQYGTSADVLGAIVETVSGKRFGEFLSEEIFQPLGMEDTGFWVPEDKRERLVKTYAEDGKGGLVLYTGNHLGIVHRMDREPAFESGGAGLASTLDDYAKFAQMLIKGGELNGVRIMRQKTVKYLTNGTLNTMQQKSFDNWLTLAGHSYGNLLRVMTNSGRAGDFGYPCEYGWDGWLGAYFCNCPKEDLTILFMMQKTDAGTNALTRKLRNIILSSV